MPGMQDGNTENTPDSQTHSFLLLVTLASHIKEHHQGVWQRTRRGKRRRERGREGEGEREIGVGTVGVKKIPG